MRLGWARRIPVLWLCSALGVSSGLAQALDDLARQYRKQPTAAVRASLLRIAKAHPKDTMGAQALFALGAVDFERGETTTALENLRAAQPRLSKIGDRLAFLIASALDDPAAAAEAAAPVWTHQPASPLASRAVLLAAKAFLDAQEPRRALDLLRAHQGNLPPPEALLLLARAAEAAGDPASAAAFLQQVYYTHPTSNEAAEAEGGMARLRTVLGSSFPPAMPQAMTGRAYKLLRGGSAVQARRELDALAPELNGPDRDLARVRACEADYYARDNRGAYECLSSLAVTDRDADAERLYYMHAAARRLNRDADALAAVESLGRSHPASPWRLEALLSAGNALLLRNDARGAEPYWRACHEDFGADPRSAYCHWKAVWDEYMRRSPNAAAMLREHIARYPASEKIAAAMYFLGRSAERANDAAGARGWYRDLAARFPNYFHAVLARERLNGEAVEAVGNPPVIAEDAPTRLRIERARLLSGAGFDDWAEEELVFAAKTDSVPHAIAMELADLATRRGAPDRGIRYIKNLAGGYLSVPLAALPERFWKLAFPLPYRQALEQNSRERSLDPFLVAALIRQESEFNPQAVSRARAYGLTQVLPSTGRELSRQLGVRPFTSSLLFKPDINLKLGTYYLRQLLDQLGGDWEATLAAYNAGKTRVLNWRTWRRFEEPAEFIESIPFSETRNYVQMVLRNADIYRRLYRM